MDEQLDLESMHTWAERRYARVLVEVQFEIVDPLAAKASYLSTSDGDPDLATTAAEATLWAVQTALLEGIQERAARVGLKWTGASPIPRVVKDGRHPEFTFPSMPAKNDAGEFDE